MGQHNLTSAQSNKPLNELRKQYFAGKWNIHSRVDVDEVLKELIFKQVKDKRSRYDPDTIDFLTLLKLLEERGNNALQRYDCFDKLGWSVTHVEFSQSLLIWHVATLVCYIDDSQNNSFAKERNCVMSSRSLSDYMLYLLVYRPTMLAIKLSGTGYAETTTICCIKLNPSRRSRKATTGQPATSCDRPATSHQPQPPAAFTPLAASRLHTWRLKYLVLNSCINR